MKPGGAKQQGRATREREKPGGSESNRQAEQSYSPSPWPDRIRHLRLRFVYVLSPLFLWGVLLAGAGISTRAVIGFVMFHLFLYGGANAYNTFYDRDVGPIGGLKNPPLPDPGLGLFSVLWQGIGALGALWIGWEFLAVYLVLWGLFTAYSRKPWPRWKASVARSLVVVGLGQGGLAVMAGAFCVGIPARAMLSSGFIAGAVGALLITVGLYPISQLYQIHEDQERHGETSLAARLGLRGTANYTAICWLLAAPLLAWPLWEMQMRALAVGVALYVFASALGFRLWLRRRSGLPSYNEVMRMQYFAATFFLICIVARLLWPK